MRAILAVGIGGILYTAPAVFAEEAKTEVSKNFYLDYNLKLNHDDHGETKTKAAKPTKTTAFDNSEVVYLGFTGEHGKNLKWDVYALISGELDFSDRIENASVTYKLNKMFSFQLGRQYIFVGGLEWKNATYTAAAINAYINNLPVSGSNSAYTVHFNLGKNRFSAQFTDDVKQLTLDDKGTACTTCYFNDHQKQPALFLEYEGEFGPVRPLVQIAPYDGLNHSLAWTLGLTFAAKGLNGYADYTSDSRELHVVATDKTTTTVYNSMNLSVAYTIGPVTPFFKFSDFDVKQDGTDLKVNTSVTTIDDNQTTFALGVQLATIAPAFIPYLMFRSTMEDVPDEVDATKKSSKTKAEVIFGVQGTI